ncbi:MAG: AAA family ATPase [Dactylosporangium sp.]|nr:AAA family ATPase [Dactylosporangium sp.]NNJ60584.1 AAA family ATPase [Dactylosporangium sp.]
MYLSEITINNFRQFGSDAPGFTLRLQPGVTALVGENDTGKSAVVDAVRYALLTRDVDYIKVRPDDFHIAADGTIAREITIRCRFSDLSTAESGAFVEYLTREQDETSLYVLWEARRLEESPIRRRLAEVTVRTGPTGLGPVLDPAARQHLSAAYLKPLRDAEREMAPGPGSRLSQVLGSFPGITDGEAFDAGKLPEDAAEAAKLSLAGMTDYLRHLVNQHHAVANAQESLNDDYLTRLVLSGESLQGQISFAEGGNEKARLRQILERLQLDLLEGASGQSRGRYGLGSNNLLYMACELLLLSKDPEGLPLLLIEEPEAHLHPQRQLRLMEFLAQRAQSKDPASRPVQVLVTTHSPNLASKIPLKNLVLIDKQRAYSLAPGQTNLSTSDYRFLERFLDSTKANLFFARGVLVVEGDAEAILMPTIANKLDRDLTKYGVSIVNVGGTGLRRYAKILQRHDLSGGYPSIPVACMTDMDVMPDCAPQILDLVADDTDAKWMSPKRRWKAVRDFTSGKQTLDGRKADLSRDDGQSVKTFVSDAWTFEYDLAFAGLAKEVYVAASLAAKDDHLTGVTKLMSREEVEAAALAEFEQMQTAAGRDNEVLCTNIYSLFASRTASKAVAAQYLAELLEKRNAKELRTALPAYVVEAIEYATGSPLPKDDASAEGGASA